MGAGEPVVDPVALVARVPGYICPRVPAVDLLTAGGTPAGSDDDRSPGFPLGDSQWRRERYAWLYDDEDIWAAPQP
jgi:hypothetical protein